MALFHTLRFGAEYMSAYVQLPVFVASLRQKNMLSFRFALNRIRCYNEFFYAAVKKKVLHEPVTMLFLFVTRNFFYPFAAVFYGHEQ